MKIIIIIVIVLVTAGCFERKPPPLREIKTLRCYSGGQVVLDREVLEFDPRHKGFQVKNSDSYWCVESERYFGIEGLECIKEPTGEFWSESP